MRLGPRKRLAIAALGIVMLGLGVGVWQGWFRFDLAVVALGIAIAVMAVAYADIRDGRRTRRLERRLTRLTQDVRKDRAQGSKTVQELKQDTQRISQIESSQIELAKSVSDLSEYVMALEDRQGRMLLARALRLETALDTRFDRVDSRVDKVLSEQGRRYRAQSRDLQATARLIEAAISLHSEMGVDRPLPPTGRWAASSDLLLYLHRLVMATRPGLIIECGSGVSTVVMGAAAASVNGKVLSIEHDQQFVAKTQFWCDRAGVADSVELIHAPLVEVEVNSETYQWYDVSTLPPTEPAQLLFVDGPPANAQPQARFPAVFVLADRLDDNAIVVLDDEARPAEEQMLGAWQAVLPTHERIALRHDKGTGILAPPGSVAGQLE